MTSQFTNMTLSTNLFDFLLFLLSILVTGPGFMSILSVVLELWQFTFIRDWLEIRKSEIPSSEVPIWIPNIWGLAWVRDKNFGPDVSNEMLLNAAKCQGYSFYLFWFWVTNGKPTGGLGLINTCGASLYRIRAVLSHKYPDNSDRPAAKMLVMLVIRQKKYSQTKKGVILAADKESCTVILNKSGYIRKISNIIEEGMQQGKYLETIDTNQSDLKHFQDFLYRHFKKSEHYD